MNIEVEFDQEEDGRWIAEIPSLPGVMAYGATREHAGDLAVALALRVVADMLENGEVKTPMNSISVLRHEPVAVS